MKDDINQKYLEVVNKIENDVYDFHEISSRKDLIFVYVNPSLVL